MCCFLRTTRALISGQRSASNSSTLSLSLSGLFLSKYWHWTMCLCASKRGHRHKETLTDSLSFFHSLFFSPSPNPGRARCSTQNARFHYLQVRDDSKLVELYWSFVPLLPSFILSASLLKLVVVLYSQVSANAIANIADFWLVLYLLACIFAWYFFIILSYFSCHRQRSALANRGNSTWLSLSLKTK